MTSSSKGWRAFACALGMLGTFAPQFAAAWPGGSEKPADLATDARSKAVLEIVKRLDDPQGVGGLVLAPDGAHAALLGWTGKARRLLLMDTATLKVSLIKAYANLDNSETDRYWPVAVHWIDAERMVVDWSDGKAVVMGLDGSRIRTVGAHVIRLMRKPDGTLDDWAIVSDTGLFHGSIIHRVNLRTGDETNVPIDLPGQLVRAAFDSHGDLRVALTRDTKPFGPGSKLSTWYRHDEKSPWRLLQESPAAESNNSWSVSGVLDDDRLLVLSREGRDTWALFTYDVNAHKLGELVAGHPTEDVASASTQDEAPVRVVTQGMKRTTWWFDADWDRIQRAVDAALPSTTNVIAGDPKRFVQIFSYSDRDPGMWRMLDTAHMKMRPLARLRLAVDPAQMRPMQATSYEAADGLKIPAFVTVPAGPVQPRPMVVLIHGGPAARDYWMFDYDVQVLAAAGYAVFQPQFRGSTGFGKAFEVAGYRQWGLAMQDDVTAGVKAMIARGVADPKRICIYGGSYGGYAAMWGLAKTPELYRCGITVSGVSDIGALFTDWSDVNDDAVLREELRFRVGDATTMKSQFDEVSPVRHADRIRVPVLIAHGERDRRAPIDHAKRLESALEGAHKSVQVQWYPLEGHGFYYDDDREHFSMLAVGFLDRNIGPASPMADRWVPVPATTAASAASAP